MRIQLDTERIKFGYRKHSTRYTVGCLLFNGNQLGNSDFVSGSPHLNFIEHVEAVVLELSHGNWPA